MKTHESLIVGPLSGMTSSHVFAKFSKLGFLTGNGSTSVDVDGKPPSAILNF